MKRIAFLIVLLGLASCKTYSEEDKVHFDQEIQAYLAKKNIDCERSSSGLYYQIQEQGNGKKITYTDVVVFKYKGELLDGTVFDNQMNEPLEFKVEQLIGAWKEILLELNDGGKAFLVAPPQLGYGSHELEKIPAHSILVYEIEVVSVK